MRAAALVFIVLMSCAAVFSLTFQIAERLAR